MAKKRLSSINKKTFGHRVYLARTGANWTVAQMAKEIEISSGFLRKIEQGRQLPSLRIFIKLFTALHIAPDYFLRNDLEADFHYSLCQAIEILSHCSQQECALLLANIKNVPLRPMQCDDKLTEG